MVGNWRPNCVSDPTLPNSGVDAGVRALCVSFACSSASAAQAPSRVQVAPPRVLWSVHPQAALRRGQRTADHSLYDSLTGCFTETCREAGTTLGYLIFPVQLRHQCSTKSVTRPPWGLRGFLSLTRMTSELGSTRRRVLVTRSSRYNTRHTLCK